MLDFFKKLKNANDGQLLIELLISLFVGGMFLLGATLGVTSILRYSFETRGNQAASGYANDVLNQVQLLANSDWHGLYDLSKGSTNHYFLNQRGSATVVIPGTESVLYNDVTAGLVGQWKFDEDIGTTTYDTSGNGKDGLLVNDTTRVIGSNCITGNCLSFNGSNNYASSSFSGTINIASDDISVSVWVKLSTMPSINPRIISFAQDANNGYSLVAYGGSGYNSFVWEVKKNGSTYGVGLLSAQYVSGQWYHLVGTFNNASNSPKLYVNGILASGGGGALSIPTVFNTLFIGTKFTDSFFPGSIDDARIYNRVLSANEVQSLYESPIYNRYFFTENTNRDTNLNIVSTGGVVDPSTQKVTVGVTWEGGRQLQLYHYFMRNTIFVLHNNNWSGGPGNTGTTTSATSTFAASYNIATSTVGQISLATTTVSGWLESATLDTQTPQGAAINSVLWQGVQPVGTNVKFQIAMSNNADGPWGYAGYDGSESTYFSPASSNISVDVENFHNYRYFRYKIFLNPSGGAGPIVMGSMINWSK